MFDDDAPPPTDDDAPHSHGEAELPATEQNGAEQFRRPLAKPENPNPTTAAPTGTAEPSRPARCGARFVYHDAEERLLGGADRITTADGGKTFRQWRHDGNGKWEAKGIVSPPPYRLPELLRRCEAPVLVCEGEKAAEVAQARFPGCVPTTSLGGSGAAHKTDWSALAGRRVVIWPDCDAPGRKYARDVSALLSLKHDTEACVVDVPADWPKGWDLADDLPAGVTNDDLERMLRDARPLAADAGADDGKSTKPEWPEPEPLPEILRAPSLYDDCGDGRAWLDAAMPARLARYIRAVARGNELSPGVVAAMSLPALAIALGPGVTGRGNVRHRETLSNWCLALEPPGNRKSEGAKAATAPLAALAQRIAEDGATQFSEWSTRHAGREMELAAAKKALSAHYDAKATGKPAAKPLTPFRVEELRAELTALTKAEADDPMPGPFELLTTNPTPEAVIERVASLRRYGAFAAEGATILLGVAEYRDKGNSGAPVGHWCSLYSGDFVSVARKGKPALTIPAGSAILCVGLTVQPSVMDRAMADEVLGA